MLHADPRIAGARHGTRFADDLGAHGDRVALWTPERTVTYAELAERVDGLASRIGPARRLVRLHVRNDIESIVAYLAALRAGHVALLAADAPGIDAIYDADVVLRAGGGTIDVDVRRTTSSHDLHPDLAALLSTSGSTGSPKLVRLSHNNLDANAAAIAEALGIRADDRAATTLPMHYCYGLSVINSHLARGASVLVTDHSVVDRCFWEDFARAEGTTFAGVPHTFDLLDRVGFDRLTLPSLRYVTQAGGRLAPETAARFAALGRRRGWDLVVMYGQTEATARMAYVPPSLLAEHPAAIGVAIPGGSLHIEPHGDDPDCGELVYRGPNVMLGYADGPDDLAVGATLDVLRTGDLARRNDAGLFEIVGRRSRFLKLFGLRIGLDDLERRLDLAGVPALCAGDDERLVVGVLDDALTDAEILRLLGVELPRRCVHVVRVHELPRLPTGKPDHGALLAQCGRAPEASVSTSVGAIYAEVLGRDVQPEDSFVSLGGDSLSYVEMSIRLEDAIGSLPDSWHVRSIGELQRHRDPGRDTRVHEVETNVVLRAVAIVLIVAGHVGLLDVAGSAHVLLAVAGFSFARFQLPAGPSFRSIARIAVPSMCWIGVAAATHEDWSVPHALLLHGVVGDPDGRWGYWFVEALVHLLVAATAALSIARVRRRERREPFRFALGVLALGLAIRFDVLPAWDLDHRIYRPHEVLWLFGIGWATAVATNTRQRLVVTLAAVAAAPGFFHQPERSWLVLAGVLALIWLPRLPLVAPLHLLVGRVAGASLAIYLLHWQLYPTLRDALGRPLALLGSIAAGVAVTAAADRRRRSVSRSAAARASESA